MLVIRSLAYTHLAPTAGRQNYNRLYASLSNISREGDIEIYREVSVIRERGFTLLELMIVVAVIGVLALIALSAYQNYSVRSKVSEALVLASTPKSLVSDAFQTDGAGGVLRAAGVFNARPPNEKQSKYVAALSIDGASGAITVTLASAAQAGIPADAAGATLVLTPNVSEDLIGNGGLGSLDWACASSTSTVADSRNLVSASTGTLPAKYAPTECR